MSGKSDKKLRQYFRKDIRDQYYLIRKAIKPRPRWCPKRLWYRIVRMVFEIPRPKR